MSRVEELDEREDELVNLEDGEVSYTPLSVEFISFENNPEFNDGYRLINRFNEHIFLPKLKLPEQEVAFQKVYAKVIEMGGDLLDTGDKDLLSIADNETYKALFLNYVKLYNTFKGLKHLCTFRAYRIIHPKIYSLNGDQKAKVKEELRKIRGTINKYDEIVITTRYLLDPILIDLVKLCIYKALENPSMEVKYTMKVGADDRILLDQIDYFERNYLAGLRMIKAPSGMRDYLLIMREKVDKKRLKEEQDKDASEGEE